ncbi:hypothetical protein Pyn_00387 [Prunus yedoensis var. nudiflora]|uniref:Uncharacterized protein n=1 Tax=Prunus yedoensis var. nudiflora TaxID=2094558 RepID=A0A314ZB17_PRUYE|nr:hypothetical protein Pyn_00387 [Prunus yedoensis var. nudiflora]
MNDSVNKLFTIAMDKEWAYTAELRIWFLGKLSQGFGGAILIPGFCSPKALKPLLPVFLSELEDLEYFVYGYLFSEQLTQDALCMDKNNMTAESCRRACCC